MLKFCNGEPQYKGNGWIGTTGLFIFGLIYNLGADQSLGFR